MLFKVIAVLSWLLGLCHLLVLLGWSDSQVQPGAAEIKQLWPVCVWTKNVRARTLGKVGKGMRLLELLFPPAPSGVKYLTWPDC